MAWIPPLLPLGTSRVLTARIIPNFLRTTRKIQRDSVSVCGSKRNGSESGAAILRGDGNQTQRARRTLRTTKMGPQIGQICTDFFGERRREWPRMNTDFFEGEVDRFNAKARRR